ncbi:MAG: ABC transporter permease, partial [Acidobacteriota bacterium]
MNTIDISPWRLSLGYLLLILPFGIILWRRIPIFGQTLTAVVRMTLQLLFVGLYLQVVFKLDNPWINGAWLLVMIGVADASIARTSRIRLRTFALTLFAALAVGTAVPLAVFVGPILNLPNLMEAQYVIPIGGMILGNCLRSDIIGISDFYERLRRGEKVYLQNLAQGAALHEALRPYIRDACEAALKPT